MEDVKETLKKKKMKDTIKLSIILTIILVVFEIIFCICNNAFIIFAWVPALPVIYMLKRKMFFDNAEFCYGKVAEVTLDDNDDVHRSTKIEFMDSDSKKMNETFVIEHWGDFREEDKEKINEFYEEGKKRIGKRIPLFYKKGNPAKNIVFLDYIED